MDQVKMGKLIAKVRKAKEMTQDELGELLGVNGKAVSKWECGINLPDISILNNLSDILEIDLYVTVGIVHGGPKGGGDMAFVRANNIVSAFGLTTY